MIQRTGLWERPLCFLKKILPNPDSITSGRVVEAEAMREGSGSPVTE